MADIIIRRSGAAKTEPFTICIVANPALETPWKSGMFSADPILTRKSDFDAAVQYIDDCLFAGVPGIQEQLLNDPAIAPNVRLVTIWDPTATVRASNALVGLDSVSNILIARRNEMKAFVASYSISGVPITADIVYGVSSSNTHNRASAWFTSDDNARPGVGFTLDGAPLVHRYYCEILERLRYIVQLATLRLCTSSNTLFQVTQTDKSWTCTSTAAQLPTANLDVRFRARLARTILPLMLLIQREIPLATPLVGSHIIAS